MRRQSLKNDIGNKVRFEYAQIDSFSTVKTDKLVGARMLFSPTILLVNLYASQRNGGSLEIDHLWAHFYPWLLPLKLCIGDCLSFTARPMKYEKANHLTGKVFIEIGVDTIFNIQFLSRMPNHEKNSFDAYLEAIIWDKKFIVPDTYLKYYYSVIVKERNESLLRKSIDVLHRDKPIRGNGLYV